MSIWHSQSGLAFETKEFLDIRHFGGLVDLMWYVEDDGGWVDVEARLYSFRSSKCSRGGLEEAQVCRTGTSENRSDAPEPAGTTSTRVSAPFQTQPCDANRAEIAPVAWTCDQYMP